ncbi:TatD family hydrolase [Streptomyces sp. NPDC088354]|uniref:TatD family hydrolase n=1 Tax=Streptomyces sp. NPDC088354 TaxID=3365856 RepID=UPI003813F10D
MSALWDTHCHLTGYDRPTDVMAEAATAGVTIVAVSEDPGQYRMLRTRLGRRPGIVPALGMHPLHAASFTPADLARFLRLLPDAPWIGEIGLDLSPAGRPSRRAQLRIFEAILSDPRATALPLTIHSRGAELETIERLAQAGASRAILHWYTGPLRLLDQAVNAGLWFSVNPAMIASARAQRLLREIPPDRVLLETDGPFTRHNNKPSRPSDLPDLLPRLAALWSTDKNGARNQLNTNQTIFFSPPTTS